MLDTSTATCSTSNKHENPLVCKCTWLPESQKKTHWIWKTTRFCYLVFASTWTATTCVWHRLLKQANHHTSSSTSPHEAHVGKLFTPFVLYYYYDFSIAAKHEPPSTSLHLLECFEKWQKNYASERANCRAWKSRHSKPGKSARHKNWKIDILSVSHMWYGSFWLALTKETIVVNALSQ